MAVTVSQIQEEFPEFRNVSAELIAAKLDDAVQEFPAIASDGDLYEQMVKYQACHLIALSPNGEFARIKYPNLEPDGATTIYERRVKAILRTIPMPMVL